jgi:hypothetical protein
MAQTSGGGSSGSGAGSGCTCRACRTGAYWRKSRSFSARIGRAAAAPRPGSDSRRSHIRRRWHHKDGLAKGPGSETRPGLGAAASAAALALTLERLSCSIAHFPRRRAFSTCFVVICKGTTVSI